MKKEKESLFSDSNFLIIMISSAIIIMYIFVLELFHGKETFDWAVNASKLSGFLILLYVWDFRSKQTNEQIEKGNDLYELTNKNINFTNHYKHRELFATHVNEKINFFLNAYNLKEDAIQINDFTLYMNIHPNSHEYRFDTCTKDSRIFEYINAIPLDKMEALIKDAQHNNSKDLADCVEQTYMVCQMLAHLMAIDFCKDPKIQINRVGTDKFKDQLEKMRRAIDCYDFVPVAQKIEHLSFILDLSRGIIIFSRNKEIEIKLIRISELTRMVVDILYKSSRLGYIINYLSLTEKSN